MQAAGGSPGMSQLLESLRVQLEDQVAALQQRRQQLRATLQEDVESASVQVQNQYQVLDNLRYEAEVLTEKLMKLRSSRQDIEAELFMLKDKRIKLLDVISKLEDEEMQLVAEVSRIMHHKRSLLKEIPCFEARARASASLAVVQDYLLASVQHLTHLQGGGSVSAAAPSWSGTANVLRPSANWISMPAPAVSAPSAAAAAAADAADEAAAASGSGVAGAAEAVERLQLESGGTASSAQAAGAPAPPSPGTAPQQRVAGGPFAALATDQLLKMQQMDGGSIGAEGLPTLHEGQPFTSADLSAITANDSIDLDVRAQGILSRSSSSFTSDVNRAAAAAAGAAGARPGGRDGAGSWSSFNSRGSDGSFRSSSSVRSISTAGAPAAGSGSFTSPTGILQRRSSDGRGDTGEGAAAAGQQQQRAAAGGVSMRTASQPGLMPPPPPPPPRRSRSMHGQLPSSAGLQVADQQDNQAPPQHLILQDLPSPSVFMQEVQQSPGPQQYLLVQQQHSQPADQQVQMQLPFHVGPTHSQQVLLLEHLMPGGVGLTSPGFDPTTPAGSLDVAVSYSPSSLRGGLQGLQGSGVSGLPLSVSSSRTTPNDMWMMPGAALVLQQADAAAAADKQALQGLPGMMAVQQQMQGLTASGSVGSGGAPDARQLFVQQPSTELGGSGGGAGSGPGSVVLLTSPDAVQPGGLFVQQAPPSH